MDANPLLKTGWTLTFHDEFDRPLLNDLYWYPAYRSGRGDFVRRTGGEYKWYDDNAYFLLGDSSIRLRVDKALPIRPTPETPCVSCICTSDHRFGETTEEVRILDKFSQKYGYYEMRAKGVSGSGWMAAFWLHQVDPRDQEYTPEGERRSVKDGVLEIDIFEQRGRFATPQGSQIDYNVHFTDNAHYLDSVPCDVSADYHIYAMEWEEGKIVWYFDNQPIRTYTGPTPQKKMFLLAALFHYESWLGDFPDKIDFPVDFEIDYIRVYKKNQELGK